MLKDKTYLTWVDNLQHSPVHLLPLRAAIMILSILLFSKCYRCKTNEKNTCVMHPALNLLCSTLLRPLGEPVGW